MISRRPVYTGVGVGGVIVVKVGDGMSVGFTVDVLVTTAVGVLVGVSVAVGMAGA